MATSVENFIKYANFYNQMATMMSAICVRKGGIAIENYVGRFFAADVLEFIVEYSSRLEQENKAGLTPQVKSLIQRFRLEFDKVKSLTTPTQKPIHEMTLEEFEKVMNI